MCIEFCIDLNAFGETERLFDLKAHCHAKQKDITDKAD